MSGSDVEEKKAGDGSGESEGRDFDTSVYMLDFDGSAGWYLSRWVLLCQGKITESHLHPTEPHKSQYVKNKISWLLECIKRDIDASKRVVIASASTRNHAYIEYLNSHSKKDLASCFYFREAVDLLNRLHGEGSVIYHKFWLADLECDFLGQSVDEFLQDYPDDPAHIWKSCYIATGTASVAREEVTALQNFSQWVEDVQKNALVLKVLQKKAQRNKCFLLTAAMQSLVLPEFNNWGRMRVRVIDDLLFSGSLTKSPKVMCRETVPYFRKNPQLVPGRVTLQFTYLGAQKYVCDYTNIIGVGAKKYESWQNFKAHFEICLNYSDN